MKVVIFCGGLGVRMGEATQRTPKPMIEIGAARFSGTSCATTPNGDTTTILCLGYRGEVVKEYFLTYNEALFNDFVLERNGGSTKLELLTRDVGDWRVTFVDTGADSTIDASGSRSSDRDSATMTCFSRRTATASRMRLFQTSSTFKECEDGNVPLGATGVQRAPGDQRQRRNRAQRGGHESLRDPYQRRLLRLQARDPRPDRAGRRSSSRRRSRSSSRERRTVAYPYDGFFGPMDTIKDQQRLEALHESGHAPWLGVGLSAR